MAEHTPEPWEVDDTVEGELTVFSPSARKGIALLFRGSDVYWGSELTGHDEATANAHLIRAAPEMMEALEALVRLTKVQQVLETWELGSIRAIIAKAKGG